MGNTLNTIIIIFLMLVSGYGGYKMGDLQLSKLNKEIKETKEALEQAQTIHIQEIAKINKEYDTQKAVLNTTHVKETQKLETIISNKEKSIVILKKMIEKTEGEIDTHKNERLTIFKKIHVLEARDNLSSDEKDLLGNLRVRLQKKDNQIKELQNKKLTAKQEQDGLDCLKKFVPIFTGEEL